MKLKLHANNTKLHGAIFLATCRRGVARFKCWHKLLHVSFSSPTTGVSYLTSLDLLAINKLWTVEIIHLKINRLGVNKNTWKKTIDFFSKTKETKQIADKHKKNCNVNCTNLSVIRGPKLEFGGLGSTGTAPEKKTKINISFEQNQHFDKTRNHRRLFLFHRLCASIHAFCPAFCTSHQASISDFPGLHLLLARFKEKKRVFCTVKTHQQQTPCTWCPVWQLARHLGTEQRTQLPTLASDSWSSLWSNNLKFSKLKSCEREY